MSPRARQERTATEPSVLSHCSWRLDKKQFLGDQSCETKSIRMSKSEKCQTGKQTDGPRPKCTTVDVTQQRGHVTGLASGGYSSERFAKR
ncbi:hypothetical protein CB1_000832012 [Camelus ferus]|nr:hypothetical protein CB1_000832012 [Camelus ferus]